MMKKYLQLLLSVNFCLTAISVATLSDADGYNSVLLEDESHGEDREITLNKQFSYIWDCLYEINRMYRYQSLQSLIDKYDQKTPFQYNEEISEREIEEKIANQFEQITNMESHFFVLLESSYRLPERATESELTDQLENIRRSLSEIIESYQPWVYSKRDKVFLSNKLEQFITFAEKFISELSNIRINLKNRDTHPIYTKIYPVEVHESILRTDDIRASLESCQEEDALMYTQYETFPNATFKKIKIEDFLTDSQANKNTFKSFNKEENLIGIQHVHDGKILCTTMWKIRPSDAHKAKWEAGDNISINKTGLLSKYSIYGERLDYTLGNKKSSVRANLICKSAPENTYHILTIDYFNKIVLLDNGLRLFILKNEGELERWHTNDKVFLDIDDPEGSYALMNESRTQKIWVSLTK